jgi:hypothetical protein
MEQADVSLFVLWAGVHTFCRFAIWILSPVLYIWTLYLAYLTSFVAVLLALVIPVGPQLYFIWSLWNATGALANLYTLLCAAWVVLAIIGVATRIKAETVGG